MRRVRLTRTGTKGFWNCENKSVRDFNVCHIYRLEDGRYGISFDNSMTKKVMNSFKEAREYALNMCQDN